MNCPGQDPVNDPFFGYTLAGTRNYLTPNTPLPFNSQYKCFEGYHNLNQMQPAPYDGLYEFPSATCLTPGASFTVPGSTKVYTCATVPNPAYGQPGVTGAGAKPSVLPAGKYVTEVVTPPGWELVKEEDLNLLIGDQYIAPAVAQFGGAGLGNIFITPDQASIDAANPSYTGPYTAENPYNQPFAGGACTAGTSCSTTNNGAPSNNLGRTTYGNFGPFALIQQSAPCVGLMRVVPDYLSIAPESGEVAPFAGTTRALCDRKEVTLNDAMQANADFYIYTDTPKSPPIPDSSRTTSRPNSTPPRPHTARSLRSPTCRSPTRTSTAWRFPACIRTSGAISTDWCIRPGKSIRRISPAIRPTCWSTA